MTTIREISKLTNWKDIKKALKYHYPEDKNNYEEVFYSVQKMRKRKPKHDEEEVEICVGKYPVPEGWNFNIEDRYYSIHTNQYSFSFRPWKELANIPINEATLFNNMFAEIMAHFLWEITYHGSEIQSKAKGKEIFKTVNKIHDKKRDV